MHFTPARHLRLLSYVSASSPLCDLVEKAEQAKTIACAVHNMRKIAELPTNIKDPFDPQNLDVCMNIAPAVHPRLLEMISKRAEYKKLQELQVASNGSSLVRTGLYAKEMVFLRHDEQVSPYVFKKWTYPCGISMYGSVSPIERHQNSRSDLKMCFPVVGPETRMRACKICQRLLRDRMFCHLYALSLDCVFTMHDVCDFCRCKHHHLRCEFPDEGEGPRNQCLGCLVDQDKHHYHCCSSAHAEKAGAKQLKLMRAGKYPCRYPICIAYMYLIGGSHADNSCHVM